MQVTVDFSNVAKAVKALERVSVEAVPHAARDALNTLAFEGRRVWRDEIDRAFVLRNTFTQRSLRVEKATIGRVADMRASLGSTQDYMAQQEQGAIKSAKGKHGVPIPTRAASGEAEGSMPRQKPVRRANRMSAISLRKRAGRTRAQRNAIAIAQARKGALLHH